MLSAKLRRTLSNAVAVILCVFVTNGLRIGLCMGLGDLYLNWIWAYSGAISFSALLATLLVFALLEKAVLLTKISAVLLIAGTAISYWIPYRNSQVPMYDTQIAISLCGAPLGAFLWYLFSKLLAKRVAQEQVDSVKAIIWALAALFGLVGSVAFNSLDSPMPPNWAICTSVAIYLVSVALYVYLARPLSRVSDKKHLGH